MQVSKHGSHQKAGASAAVASIARCRKQYWPEYFRLFGPTWPSVAFTQRTMSFPRSPESRIIAHPALHPQSEFLPQITAGSFHRRTAEQISRRRNSRRRRESFRIASTENSDQSGTCCQAETSSGSVPFHRSYSTFRGVRT